MLIFLFLPCCIEVVVLQSLVLRVHMWVFLCIDKSAKFTGRLSTAIQVLHQQLKRERQDLLHGSEGRDLDFIFFLSEPESGDYPCFDTVRPSPKLILFYKYGTYLVHQNHVASHRISCGCAGNSDSPNNLNM
jgi:hypothetical protein